MNDELTAPAQFTRIYGLTEKTLIPRCGKVRLGERRTKGQGPNAVEYPTDLSYFRFDDAVLDKYPVIGELYCDKTGALEPQALDIMLPVEDEEIVFPQSLRYYGKSRGLRCIGNGRQAMRFVCSSCKAMDCKCESPQMVRVPRACKCALYDAPSGCRDRGSLMFMLPRVTWEGCWQLDTGSYHNIVHINSALRFVRAVLGRISLVPLTLRRVPVDLTHQGKKRRHWLLSLGFDGDIEKVRQIRAEMRIAAPPIIETPYQLPAPILEGDEVAPVPDEPDEQDTTQEPGGGRQSDRQSDREGSHAPAPAAGPSSDPPPSDPSEDSAITGAHGAPRDPQSAMGATGPQVRAIKNLCKGIPVAALDAQLKARKAARIEDLSKSGASEIIAWAQTEQNSE